MPEGGGYPLAEQGVSPARCCRRTGHSMNMDESSEKGDAAGKTPPLQTDAGLNNACRLSLKTLRACISIFSDN